MALDAGAVRGAFRHRPRRAVGADRVVPRRDRRRLRAPGRARAAEPARVRLRSPTARRPGGLLPRPVTRRRLSRGAARAVARSRRSPEWASTEGAGGCNDRHRAAAEEVAARFLRACASPGRGVPRHCAGRRPRGLRRALPRGRATPSTTRTWMPSLPVEDRYLGDNSVTEGFAFLFEHLVSDPGVARAAAGHRRPGADREHKRARRSWCSCAGTAAKLAYELELHGGGLVDGLDAVYARRLSDAVRWTGRRRPGSRRRPVLLRRRATCARGRSRRTCAGPERPLRPALVRRAAGRRVPARPLARRSGRARRGAVAAPHRRRARLLGAA